jgi:hypothetical protein
MFIWQTRNGVLQNYIGPGSIENFPLLKQLLIADIVERAANDN